MAQWPTLLAGPQVRRVTAQRAHIFVCTSSDRRAQVRLYEGRAAHDVAASPMAQSPEVQLDRIGQRLWVGVVPVDIPTHALPGETISYDLRLLDSSGDVGLFELGLLGGTAAQVGSQHDARRARFPLGYVEGMLPSFVVPPADPADLRIVHASCRKPHGGGETEPDAMQLVDAAIAAAIAGDAADRPQQLILTGDQIYADDVAGGMLAAVSEAGRELLGWDEAVPVIDNSIVGVLLEPGWRTRFLSIDGIDIKELPEDDAPDYSANHLIRFGEWCAMYLFAWSDALWRIDSHDDYDLPRPPSALPLEAIQSVIDLADTLGIIVVPARAARALQVVDWLDQFQRRTAATWEETRTKSLGYAASVCVTRRALANVSSYMMFDDHEITDDWYLSRRVRDRLHGVGGTGAKADVGPRMMRNGLSAYAFFQHWGNVPEDFEPGRQGDQLLDKWRYTSASNRGQLATAATARSADTLLGITAADSPIPTSGQRADFVRFRWDYAVEFPGHRLIALDTRTWRHYPAGTPFTWASLAPLIPDGPGSASSSGAAELRQVAAAWRTAGTAAGAVVMGSFADLVDDVVAVAESVSQSRAVVSDRVTELVLQVDRFLGQLPGRTSLAADALLDPVSDAVHAFFTSPSTVRSALDGYASKEEVLARTIDYLRAVTMSDLGTGAQQLSLVFEALLDFLETATVQSAVGMAHAARRAVDNAGDGLWRIFTTLPTTHSANVQLLAAVHVALQAMDTLTAATGIDRLAGALFRDGSNRLGVGLIRDDALAFQVTEPVATVGADRAITLLLSPAPIFGNRLVELVQRVKVVEAIANGRVGEEELDYEGWAVNVPAMVSLFEAARALTCAVVLSGDVHYGGSSVNSVRTLHARTRYIQLVASSSRNSDEMTRGLARLDDLLYDDNGTAFFFQSDWISLLDHGSSTLEHLRLLARDEVDSLLETAANAVDVQRQYENVVHWWNSSQITLEDVLETGERVLLAAPNSARAWVTEAAWQLYAAVETIQEFRDDPMLAVFGDFLTAGPALRQELRRFYQEIGVDPSVGLFVDSTVLLDRRSDRLSLYPQVATRIAAGSAAYDVTNAWERRTVGHANAGFISFVMRDDEVVGVAHELRWYPHDEPVRHTEPMPRTDSFGTLHRAGWLGRPADLSRTP